MKTLIIGFGSIGMRHLSGFVDLFGHENEVIPVLNTIEMIRKSLKEIESE